MRRRGLSALAAMVLLAGCAILPKPKPPPTPPANALGAGVTPGPAITALGLTPDGAKAALAAFAASCPKLVTREDTSGLTRQFEWQQSCADAASWNPDYAVAFFTSNFETAEVAGGQAFATGYFEPEIAGSREHLPGYDVPVYGLPAGLVRAREGDAEPLASGKMPLGRYGEDGKFVPFYSRAEIDDGALAGRGLEIAWAKDPVELFFLQVQGSGRLVAPDGSVMRIGYAGQNGRDYTSIGAVMRKEGLIGDGPGQYEGSMQGIVRYLRENPEAGWKLMRQNESYVFFRELDGAGPLGSLGVPVEGRVSLAADPNFVPLGAPVFLTLDRPEASGLWIAQDTGGAIKGANRFDTFWGAGEEAAKTAGGMSAHGSAVLLLPKGTLARLRSQ